MALQEVAPSPSVPASSSSSASPAFPAPSRLDPLSPHLPSPLGAPSAASAPDNPISPRFSSPRAISPPPLPPPPPPSVWARVERTINSLCHNRWLGLICGLWLLACAGSSATFAIYSPALKAVGDYNQREVDGLAVAKDMGESVGLLPGLLCDALPVWALVLVGSLHYVVGFSGLFAVATKRILPLPFWQMCGLMLMGSQGTAWFNTAVLVTCVRNFPRSRGSVVGLLKGVVGLSGAIFTQVYAALIAPDQAAYLGFIAVVPPLVSLPAMTFLRPSKRLRAGHCTAHETERDVRRREEHEAQTLHTFLVIALGLAAYLLLAMLLHDSNSSQQFNRGILAGMVSFLLLPLATFLPPLFPTSSALPSTTLTPTASVTPPKSRRPSAEDGGAGEGVLERSRTWDGGEVGGAVGAGAAGRLGGAGGAGGEEGREERAVMLGSFPEDEALLGGGDRRGREGEREGGGAGRGVLEHSESYDSLLPVFSQSTFSPPTPAFTIGASPPPPALTLTADPAAAAAPVSPAAGTGAGGSGAAAGAGGGATALRSPVGLAAALAPASQRFSSLRPSAQGASSDSARKGAPASASAGGGEEERRRKQAELLLAVGEGAVRVGGGRRRAGPRRGQDFTLQQAAVKADFWLLFVSFLCGTGSGLTAINNLAQMGAAQGYSSVRVFLSLLSVSNFVGRLLAGYASEHVVKDHMFPRPVLLLLAQALMAVGHIFFALAFPSSLHLGSVIVGLCYGVHWSIMPATASEIFGLKHFGMLYNTLTAACPMGSFVFSGMIAGYLYDREAEKDHVHECYGAHCFRLTFFIMAAVCLFGVCMNLILILRTRVVYASLYAQPDAKARKEEAEVRAAAREVVSAAAAAARRARLEGHGGRRGVDQLPLSRYVPTGHTLGRGAFGTVRVCRDSATGAEVAVKTISKRILAQDNPDFADDLRQEVAILRLVSRSEVSGVVRLLDVRESRDHVHLVMERCNAGSLSALIKSRQRLPEHEAADVIRQLLTTVAGLHNLGVIHRDLKPENVLLCCRNTSCMATADCQTCSRTGIDAINGVSSNSGDTAREDCALADFGLAVCLPAPSAQIRGVAGTAFYMAPEVARGRLYGREADMWSLGVVLHVLLSGRLPFYGRTEDETRKRACAGHVVFSEKYWAGVQGQRGRRCCRC
ncbi:unnamed protein product [Closterium sp. Yama58-4]|nr:unnamed protein product [Closterium sp. Yama58-4]